MSKVEAVILVRIEDMDTIALIGQRSIRFELTEGEITDVLNDPDKRRESIDTLVAHALAEAPKVQQWQEF